MLTAGTRFRIVAFLVIAVTAMTYIATTYADLGRYMGLRDFYTVRLQLPQTGGLFVGSAVSYRGVTVGEVDDLTLTPGGVRAELRIKDSAPDIPQNLQAVVANRSAVGEQYVDLRPGSAAGPFLAQGSVIEQSRTTVPTPVHHTLASINGLAASLPQEELRTLIDELGQAFAGQGPHLQQLLDTSDRFIAASDAAFPQTKALIHNGEAVLRTQNEEAAAFQAFARNSRLLAGQLRESDPDLRRLIAVSPSSVNALADLLDHLDPHLSVLIANLTTTARIVQPRGAGIEELLVRLPQVAAMGSTIVDSGTLNLGLVNTFFNPQPCTRGYGATRYRDGNDLSAGMPFNSKARCAEPAGSGMNVRGSANAPRKGVPEPAKAGSLGDEEVVNLLGTLGLPGLGGSGAADMKGLLGLNGTAP